MLVKAKLKDAAMSAQKTRLVADQIRGLGVDKALELLGFVEKKAADLISKLLKSAIANAENNHDLDVDELFVKLIWVNEAGTLKRYKSRAKGRGNRILKRRCHIELVLAETAK